MRTNERLKLLPKNFHKDSLSADLQKYCLGSEKLFLILEHILKRGEIKLPILIPFGGPGSIEAFFDFFDLTTVAGDIEILKKYLNPYLILDAVRKKYSSKETQQSFAAWDALNLPLADNTFETAVLNPPYNINCTTESDPKELVIKSLDELKRVLKKDGRCYFIFPKKWIDNGILDEINNLEFNISIISENLSSKAKPKLQIALVCLTNTK